MHDATDMDLLRQYAEENSDAAFATLVSRHVNLVYSAALRKTGDPQAAEDITQAVFVILAQKAGRIPARTILRLLQEAYSGRQFRMILPAGVPTNHFDLMLTLRDHPKEALQKAIQRKFGFTAHRETRETDVLVLTVVNPKLLALHASKRGSKMDFKSDGKSLWAYSNFPISTEAQILEPSFFKPVILQPGLSGNYDITFQWDYDPQDAQGMKHALANELAQAGLELVPSREPIEMLVVEKK